MMNRGGGVSRNTSLKHSGAKVMMNRERNISRNTSLKCSGVKVMMKRDELLENISSLFEGSVFSNFTIRKNGNLLSINFEEEEYSRWFDSIIVDSNCCGVSHFSGISTNLTRNSREYFLILDEVAKYVTSRRNLTTYYVANYQVDLLKYFTEKEGWDLVNKFTNLNTGNIIYVFHYISWK